MSKTKPKPAKATVTAKTGRGRPRQPIEKREKFDPYPHKNRKGPPDIPAGQAIGHDVIPAEPPVPLGKEERKCWDRIAGSQRALEASAWIFRSDGEFLIALCIQYGRLMQVRAEIDALVDEGIPFVDENGKANPLLSIERALSSAYQTGLKELAMVPSRRQVSLAEEPEESDIDYLD